MPRMLTDIARLLDAAFPVHVVLDEEGVVVRASGAAQSWLGLVAGVHWRERLTLFGATLVPDLSPSSFAGRSLPLCARGRPKDRLRGQVVPAGAGLWALVLVPTVHGRERLQALMAANVHLAPHDPTPDLVEGLERGKRIHASLERSVDLSRGRVSALEAKNAELHAANLELRAKLRQAESTGDTAGRGRLELLGQLAGSITHDFNNLLAAILGHASQGLEKARDPEALEALRGVHEAAERAAALTARVLTFSNPSVSEGPVDAAREVKQIAGLLRRLLRDTVRMELDVDVRHAWVPLDRSRLEQILVNLAVNARDAMPAGGTVRISVATREVESGLAGNLGIAPGPAVCMMVRDTGEGIPPDVAARVFEPFFTTKGGQGTGLGLSTVQRLVQDAGGAIQLSSRPGHGTTFSIWFPEVAAAQVEPGLEAMGRIPASEGRVVLLVDDEPTIRGVVARMLSRDGWTVVQADGPEQALAWLPSAEQLALVLTDQNMPGGTGIALAAEIRQRRPGVPCIIMSGYCDEPAFLAGVQAGEFRLLSKPFDMRTLQQTVNRSVARSRLRLLDESVSEPPTMPSWVEQAS